MQTFLPDPSFAKSAYLLDDKRVGNQRLEAQILLEAITTGNGWSKHTAARMWRGYEDALRLYMWEMIREWVSRGFKNTMACPDVGVIRKTKVPMPPWLGWEPFHASHRSNLLRKDPEWYGQWGWKEDPSKPYVWPRNWGKEFA